MYVICVNPAINPLVSVRRGKPPDIIFTQFATLEATLPYFKKKIVIQYRYEAEIN